MGLFKVELIPIEIQVEGDNSMGNATTNPKEVADWMIEGLWAGGGGIES